MHVEKGESAFIRPIRIISVLPLPVPCGTAARLSLPSFPLFCNNFHIFSKNNRGSSCRFGKRLYLCTRFRKRRRQNSFFDRLWTTKRQGSTGRDFLRQVTESNVNLYI